MHVLFVSFAWLPCELSFDVTYSGCLLSFIGVVSKTNNSVNDVGGAGGECTCHVCCVFLHGCHAKLSLTRCHWHMYVAIDFSS
jgi:hypothetical protein